jgi:hypothetical protein
MVSAALALLKGKAQFLSGGAFLPESAGSRQMPFVAQKLSLPGYERFMWRQTGCLAIRTGGVCGSAYFYRH